MTCCLLTSKQIFFSVAVVASKKTHFLSLIKESDFNTHGVTSKFIWQRKWRIPSSLQPYFVKKKLTFLENRWISDWKARLISLDETSPSCLMNASRSPCQNQSINHKNLFDDPALSRSARRTFASLLETTLKSPSLCVNKKPFPVWFSRRRKSFPV